MRKNAFLRKWLCATLSASLALSPLLANAATPTLSLSNVPLVLQVKGQPQVLFLVTNSQSMDGNLSGAIMTGSGIVAANQSSSSPVNYTVPGGFTAPVTGQTSGTAPYTATVNGNSVDNSPSRLNVAKEAIQQTYAAYSNVIQFGLMDLGVSGNSVSVNNTWVYYMSGANGFQFGSSSTAPSGLLAVANPCYQSSSNSCSNIKNVLSNYPYNISGTTSQPYLYISATSDDPSINDVLYVPPKNGSLSTANLPSNILTYGGASPANPYPPNYSLQQYNQGGVSEVYPYSTGGLYSTSPTNAGYVPYTPMVWYAQRGFGFYGSVTNNNGSPLGGNLVTPVASTSSAQITAFSTALAPETSDVNSAEIKADAVNNSVASALQTALNYFTGDSPPASSNGCTPSGRYIVLVTDGLPTVDLNGNAWPPLGSAAAAGYGVTATFNTDGSLNSTNDQALTDTISQIQALAKQGIKTYVVGLGAGVDPSKNPAAAQTLTAMAVAGGTSNYFPATTPAAAAQQLGVILGQIEAQTLSTTAVASNSTSGTANGYIYQASFQSKSWIGNVTATTVSQQTNPQTGGPQLVLGNLPTWSAQTQLTNQSYSSRNIATFDPTCNKGAGCGIPFAWPSNTQTGINTTQQGQLETGWNSLTTAQQALFTSSPSSTPPASYGQAVLGYLQGNTAQQSPNGPFRSRSGILGDIVDSVPTYVGVPNAGYTDPSYQAFVQQQQTALGNKTMPPMVYVGANDGILHAFNANTGQEQFAFVPNAVFPNLYLLAQPSYSGNHHYYADGTPAIGDVPFPDTASTPPVPSVSDWQTILVAGENNGGNSVYALNITQPQTMTSPSAVANNVLWEFTDPNLGQTYGTPVIARIPYQGQTIYAAIFSSGYNNSTQTPYLYIVNAQTGALLNSVNLCSYDTGTCSSSQANGASSPAVGSTLGNGTDNRVYIGDLQGNLWRIDLTALNPANGQKNVPTPVTLLFKTQTLPASINGTITNLPQPITTPPLVTLNPNYPAQPGLMVIFGTGQLLQQSDLTNTQVQSVYGIWDKGTGSTVTQSSLVQQTIYTTNIGATQVRLMSKNPINWSTNSGWYVNLPATGERMITNMLLYAGQVIFTTYAPTPNVCGAGGSSYLMDFNYATGTSFSSPVFDVNGDGLINSLDTVINPPSGYGPNPGGIALGSGFASAPSLTGSFITLSQGNALKSILHQTAGMVPLYWRLLNGQ
jgi:type IV pilus assembly protein PilY1